VKMWIVVCWVVMLCRLMVDVIYSSKRLVPTYSTTQHHNPDYRSLHHIDSRILSVRVRHWIFIQRVLHWVYDQICMQIFMLTDWSLYLCQR
jgi:hypothetical protein